MKKFLLSVVVLAADSLSYFFVLAGFVAIGFAVFMVFRKEIMPVLSLLAAGVISIILGAVIKRQTVKRTHRHFFDNFIDDLLASLFWP